MADVAIPYRAIVDTTWHTYEPGFTIIAAIWLKLLSAAIWLKLLTLCTMARRVLKSTASNTQDLSAFQMMLMEEMSSMASHAQKQRASIRELAHAYMTNKSASDMVAEACDLYQKVTMCSVDEAQHFVRRALAPTDGEVTGLRNTTPMHWSYDRASMWSGDPDNRRLLKLGRINISSGFSASDGAIASRTLSLIAQPGEEVVRVSLLFGDGSARGVAACSVWMLLIKHRDTIPADYERISSLFLSLMACLRTLRGTASARLMSA